MKLGVLCIGLLLTGCAAKSAYVEKPTAPEPVDVVNGGIETVRVEHGLWTGSCRVYLGAFGGQMVWAELPTSICPVFKMAAEMKAKLTPKPEAPKAP